MNASPKDKEASAAVDANGARASAALRELSALLEKVARLHGEWIAGVSSLLVECFRAGGKVLCCGNGGSASQAEHTVAELVGRYKCDRRPLPAISLSDNTAGLTAISNDMGYEKVFARQIEGFGRRGDVLLAFTTSGRSPNVIEAVKAARDAGLTTVGFTGERGEQFAELCDHCLVVPSSDTPRVQEVHLAVAHEICAPTEAALFGRR
jgi:D-sedoheptulose 7-phosphate isomerase